MATAPIFKPRLVIHAILALLLAGGSCDALAAGNGVFGTAAGDGQGAISGYSASDITYTTDISDPGLISSVSFNLSGAGRPTVVRVKTGSTWHGCSVSDSNAAPWAISCTTPGAATADADELRIVAAD